MGGEAFSCLPNGAVETTTSLSFGVYLLGRLLLSTYCLLTGMVEMNNAPSTAPGCSYSGRGRLTFNQRARKPPGKCAVGKELVHVAVDPEQLGCLQQCRTLQKAACQQVSWEELAGTER